MDYITLRPSVTVLTVAAVLLLHLCISCDKASVPAAAASTQARRSTQPAAYALRPRDGNPASVTFKASREPIRDVIDRVDNGWRSITASKWMGSDIAYYLAKDLGRPVENQVRNIGDFDFDLRWKIGDLSSMNAALKPYGIEVVTADPRPASTQTAKD